MLLAEAAPLPFVQGEQDSLTGVEAGKVVGNRDADAGRCAVGETGHVHDARFPLDDRIVARQVRVRTGLPVTGDRAIDQLWIDRGDVGVAETKL